MLRLTISAIFTLLGLYMGHIFSLNHFPMQIKDKTEKRAPTPAELQEVTGDMVVHQLQTTRDVEPSMLVNWFTGHLNFQVHF
jgi:fatty acid desaturase